MSFGAFIRQKREAKGIQMNDFAAQLKLSPAYWSRVERDKENPPKDEYIRQAAQILGADVDEAFIEASCTLAGRTDLIAGFLEAKVAPSQVRSQLLTAMAQQSTEIVSRIDPNAAVRQEMAASNPASPDNPLIAAVKARIGAR